jgi:hypothetical protein
VSVGNFCWSHSRHATALIICESTHTWSVLSGVCEYQNMRKWSTNKQRHEWRFLKRSRLHETMPLLPLLLLLLSLPSLFHLMMMMSLGAHDKHKKYVSKTTKTFLCRTLLYFGGNWSGTGGGMKNIRKNFTMMFVKCATYKHTRTLAHNGKWNALWYLFLSPCLCEYKWYYFV